MSTDKIEIFCCYARKDTLLLYELEKHLAPLQHRGDITLWADIDINPGMEREEEIHRHLETAQIILLLISPDFLASEYCYNVEMLRAMERHEMGKALVIPILLRPTRLTNTLFAHLQALPHNGRPLTQWANRDEGFSDIALGISEVIKELYQAERPLSSVLERSVNPPNVQLRLERERRGWTQVELAEKIGVGIRTVERWESGMTRPSPIARRRLLEVFGKSLEELGFHPSSQIEEPLYKGEEQFYGRASISVPPFSLFRLMRAILRSLSPGGKRYTQILGKLSLVLNLNKAALSIYEKAITREPQNPDLYIAKGKALLGLKRSNEALTAYQQATHFAPDSSAAYKGQGRVFEQLAQQIFDETMQQARQSYEKAKQLGIE